MRPAEQDLQHMRESLPETTRAHLDRAVQAIVKAKNRGGRVIVATGSGPNIHEGITTLIAEMIRKELVDGVLTSSAVVAHEMAGTLDRVKRVVLDEALPNLPLQLLPRGRIFEITELPESSRAQMETEFAEGWDLYDRLAAAPGKRIIKAAGNMAWPLGLRTERLAHEIQGAASQYGVSLEAFAGMGADPLTMIGAGARRGVPVLVSIPQLVGGGAVGIAIGDSISISRRARAVADLLGSADVIIESAIALTQEIHDGPLETYTGHGIWAHWNHLRTFSLDGRTLVRIDLDPNLERAWNKEREGSEVQAAINEGRPKTKLTGIPFRMEMSGFARLESSIPVTADIGVAWPVLATEVEKALGTKLDFVPAPQETEHGKKVREWITNEVHYVDRLRMYQEAQSRWSNQ